jgi:hypothetical protein
MGVGAGRRRAERKKYRDCRHRDAPQWVPHLRMRRLAAAIVGTRRGAASWTPIVIALLNRFDDQRPLV